MEAPNPMADLGGGDKRLTLRLAEEPEDVAVLLHLDDEAVTNIKAALDRYDRMFLQDKSAAKAAAV